MIIKRECDLTAHFSQPGAWSRNYSFEKFLQMLIGLDVATERKQKDPGKWEISPQNKLLSTSQHTVPEGL